MVSLWESKRCDEKIINLEQFKKYYRDPLLLYNEVSHFKNMTKFILKNKARLQSVRQINFDDCDNIDIVEEDLSYVSFSNGNDSNAKVFRCASSKNSVVQNIRKALGKLNLSTEISVRNLIHLEPKMELQKITWKSNILDYDVLLNQIASQATVHIQNVTYDLDATVDILNPFFPNGFVNPLRHYLYEGKLIPGIQTPWYYYSFLGSNTCSHTEDLCYGGANVHLGGADQLWWGCDRKNTIKLWDKLKTHNKVKCVAHFRDKASLIKLSTLNDWGIEYKLTIQQPNEIIFSPSGCSHQVVSTEKAAKKALNYIDGPWMNSAVTIQLCATPSHDNDHGLNKDFMPNILDLETDWTNALGANKYPQRKTEPVPLLFDCDKAGCYFSFKGKRGPKKHMQMHHSNEFLLELNGDKAVSGFYSLIINICS